MTPQSFSPPNYENLESQIPEFSTQVGLENINLETEHTIPSWSSTKKKTDTRTTDAWYTINYLHLIAVWLHN
jgi:hypothetical protein